MACCFVSVAIVVLLVGVVFAYIMSPTVSYYVHKSNTYSLPRLSDHFVGREEEVSDIVRILESEVRIVNIYGAPGFGKSTLSVHVGHRMLERKVNVHYVNLDECPTNGVKLFIAEKVFESSGRYHKAVTFDKFVQWARGWTFLNLIILDNCDKPLHNQKNELQDAIQKVVDSSDSVKFLMSSRETTLHIGEFEQYKLHELSTKSACELLHVRLPSGINITMEETEELARLTGNVPLALQITGSLLRLPELGSPKSVIAKLKENVIDTLSPEQLQENMQINASFSLSYNYLDSKAKRIGQLLSNFPGSFTIDQCITTLRNFFPNKPESEVKIIIAKAIKTLVQRSLLDVASDRYQFHSLIREYFFDKQRGKKSFVTMAFARNFQVYFTKQLSSASSLYRSHQYGNSLAILDQEMHNLQQLFDGIKNHDIHSDPKILVAAVADALESGLLSTRFSHSDLLVITEKIISFFNEREKLQFDYTKGDEYLILMYHLIDLHDKVNSAVSAMDTFEQYKPRIEMISPFSGKVYYPKILIQVSNLCTKLGRHSESVEFYRQAMEYLQKKICVRHYCSYFIIGKHLMLDKNYEQAIYYLRLSLEKEEPPPLQRMSILLQLHTIFDKTFNFHQKSETLDEIIQLLPAVTKLPPHDLYHILDDLNAVLSLLRNTDSEEANMLTECVVKLVVMAADNNMLMNLDYPALTVSTLYQNGNYTKAAQLGLHVLQSVVQNPNFKHNQFSLKLLAVTGMAQVYSGNYSQGFDAMENVLEMITESHGFLYNDLFYEYWKCCFYLIPRTKYAYDCFGIPILGKVKNIINTTAYLTFVLPLHAFPSTDNHENNNVHQDVTEIKYSSSRELVVTHDSSLIKISKNNILPLLQRWLINILTFMRSLLTALMYVLSLPSVRFCINVVTILLRLDLLMILSFIGIFYVTVTINVTVKLADKISCGLFTLWPCFTKLYCFLLFSRKLHSVLVGCWKCCELLSLLFEQFHRFCLNILIINFYVIFFLLEKSEAYNHSFCSVLFFYSALYFLFSVVIVHTCLWLYMLL